MSFEMNKVYGFGSGALNDVEVQAGEIFDKFNSYAQVTEISENLITIDLENARLGDREKFLAGNEILLHVSSSLGSDLKLGKFICAKIVLADGGNLTLDKNLETDFLTSSDLATYKVQAVTFANFHCLKLLRGGMVAPPPYDTTKFYGGILAIKCSRTLELGGGHIMLNDRGVPVYQKDLLRPLTEQEAFGELDADKFAGKENLCDDDIFPLNSGDGAAFIFAKEILVTDRTSRIGNIFTHGKPNCRGAADSKYKPSNITNVGGGSILLGFERGGVYFENLAKYRQIENSNADKGKGLARCCVVSDYMPRDDKLYHAENVSRETILTEKYFLRDFGRGTYGDREDPNYRLNNSATLISLEKNQAKILAQSQAALTPFDAGTKVLCFGLGNFFTAEILKLDDDILTLNQFLPRDYLKIFSVPEFENFTLSSDYDDEIFAVYVRGKCKISGKINSNCFIFAESLEVASGAKLGDKLFLVANKVTGLDGAELPEGAMIFCHE